MKNIKILSFALSCLTFFLGLDASGQDPILPSTEEPNKIVLMKVYKCCWCEKEYNLFFDPDVEKSFIKNKRGELFCSCEGPLAVLYESMNIDDLLSQNEVYKENKN